MDAEKMELEKLLHSDNYKDRRIAAKQGYRLDILVNDENYDVREAVARQGYGLDILINDTNEDVRYEVRNYLKEHNYYSILDWAKDNNVEIDIDEWICSDDWRKRRAAAVAGYGLDVLIHDKDPKVRMKVARYGYGLDVLINDENYDVREIVAEQGYGLDKLINDEDYFVRAKVARQGYGLDVLIMDKENYVREAVQKYLKEHNYKSVIDWAKDTSTNTKQVDLSETINTFIDNIENSSMLALQTNLDSVEDFFNNDSAQIDIVTADTKVPIITITKLKEEEYKLELNVTDNAMSSKFTSTDKLLKLMDLAVSELNENSEFYKYADELNNCL